MKKHLSISALYSMLLIVMIIAGCLNKNRNIKNTENKVDIRAINESVKELNSGPDYLLRKAKYELDAGNIDSAKAYIEDLFKQYPNVVQIRAAKELLNSIDERRNNISDNHKFKSDAFSISVKNLAVPFDVVSFHTIEFTNKTILIESHEVSPPRYYHFKIISESTTSNGKDIITTLNLSSTDLPIINKLVFSTSLGYLFYSGNDNLMTYGRLSVVY